MAGSPLISVITPTHNRRWCLDRAIRSVLAQTMTDFELVVVDDGSDDGSEELVKSFVDPRIVYHRFAHRRIANVARNHGIAISRGELVALLDSDDEYLPQRLERTVAVLAAHPSIDVLLSSYHRWNGSEVVACTHQPTELVAAELETALMSHAVLIAGSAITVRRPLLIECGGFAPHLRRMQDRQLLLAIALCRRESDQPLLKLLPQPDWVKHESPDSISAPATGFVTSLGEMVACHPELLATHGDLVRYLIARAVRRQVARGRLADALGLIAENRRVKSFRFGVLELAAGYMRGHKTHRGMVRRLRDSRPVEPALQAAKRAA